MAQIYNPWESPPTTNTLSGDLASFEINGAESPEDSMEDKNEHGKPLKEALSVISQQSQLIAKLMAMLEPASSAAAPISNKPVSNEFTED